MFRKFPLLKVVLSVFLISCGAEVSRDKDQAYADSVTESFAKQKAKLALQNEPGNLANDFSFFYTLSGGKKQMYSLEAKYTLLFFYNPECEACKEYKDML